MFSAIRGANTVAATVVAAGAAAASAAAFRRRPLSQEQYLSDKRGRGHAATACNNDQKIRRLRYRRNAQHLFQVSCKLLAVSPIAYYAVRKPSFEGAPPFGSTSRKPSERFVPVESKIRRQLPCVSLVGKKNSVTVPFFFVP